MINSYFDKIYCINLDRRPDKWAISEAEFRKHGLAVERFPGVDGQMLNAKTIVDGGNRGCSLSHVGVLRDIIARGYERVLVLEDDVEFIPNVQEYFDNNVRHIPAQWDMLYLGGNHLETPVPINEAISRITRTYTTSHYAITKKMAETVVNSVEDVNADVVDVVYSMFHRKSQSFTFNPSIAWQRAGISDIHGVFADYTSFMKPKNIK